MKKRVAVLRLFHGGFLGGRSHLNATQFHFEDAQRFLQAFHTRDWNDLFWGMSLEVLPKRGKYSPLTSEQIQTLIVQLKSARLIAEADKYDRMAKGYDTQAEHAKAEAIRMREKAKQLRAINEVP